MNAYVSLELFSVDFMVGWGSPCKPVCPEAVTTWRRSRHPSPNPSSLTENKSALSMSEQTSGWENRKYSQSLILTPLDFL